MSVAGNREKARGQEAYQVNEHIRNQVVQVIDQTGENLGEMQCQEALVLAEEANLDLVKVGQKGTVAVAKIMDFGKFLYEKKKEAAKAKKHHKVIQIKEIKMRPRIGAGDYQTKIDRAIKFLQEGKRVKFTLRFRGRQPVSVREIGIKFFERIKNDIAQKKIGTLIEEKETRGGGLWSKVFYVKEQL